MMEMPFHAANIVLKIITICITLIYMRCYLKIYCLGMKKHGGH
jgi:hypothetical protein